MAPEYDHLTQMQKVEVFEHAIEHTSGDDLAKVLWLKSPSSEVSAFSRLTVLRECMCTCAHCLAVPLLLLLKLLVVSIMHLATMVLHCVRINATLFYQ